MGATTTIETDVCVIGAGIVGLAHALEARARGLRVVLLERSERAVGASVRNFGHGFVAAMSDGRALEYALHGRERWIELGARAGFDVVQAGTLLVVRDADELAVIESVARDPRRGATVIGPREAAALAPIPVDGLIGAMHARLDIRVDPRTAAGALAALLEQDSDALVLWGAPAHAVHSGAVQSARVTVSAPRIVICPGPDFDTLPAEVRPTRNGLTRCKLQMLRVASPGGRRYAPALLTGLSLVRYPAFTATAENGRVRERLEAQRPELLAAGVHVIVTQLPSGDLIIGDTHEQADTASPFSEERLDRLLLAEACRLLGVDELEVRERWQGIYPVAPGDPFLVEDPLPGVRLVQVVAGVGMTTAFGLARAVLEDFSDRAPAPRAAPRPSAGAPAGYGS